MKYTENLIKFIENSPSPFHVCDNLAKALPAAGYTERCEAENLALAAGKGYFVRRNASSIIAFRMPKSTLGGFMICASHSDSPTFKIKDNAELTSPMYVRINAELYGGLILGAWLDRPLSVAGMLRV